MPADFLYNPWTMYGALTLLGLAYVFRDPIIANYHARFAAKTVYSPVNVIRKGAIIRTAEIIEKDEIPIYQASGDLGKEPTIIGSKNLWAWRITDVHGKSEYVWTDEPPEVCFQKAKFLKEMHVVEGEYLRALQDSSALSRMLATAHSQLLDSYGKVDELITKQARTIGTVRKETGPNIVLPNKGQQQSDGGQQPFSESGGGEG